MITDAVLYLLSALLDLVGAVFPLADLTDWPSAGTSIGTWIGQKAGPVNGILPVSEFVVFVDFALLKFLPAVLVYEGITWAYRHLPVIGAG